MRPLRALALCATLSTLLAPCLAAQAEGSVELLAPLLRAEDTRQYDAALFESALGQPDALVRQTAIRAIGRIRDTQGLPLLIDALRDRDSTLVSEAAFALGQMGDSAAVPELAARLSDPAFLLPPAMAEIVTALAKIGGPEAGAICAGALSGTALATDTVRRQVAAQACLREGWRFGKNAPLTELRSYLTSTDDGTRAAAYYSIGRLGSIEDAPQLLSGLHDGNKFVRSASARALVARYADSARLDRSSTARQLAQLTGDDDPGVRVQALRAIGTYKGVGAAAMLAPQLADPVPNVGVAAAQAIGTSGDTAGVRTLGAVLDQKGSYALRRAALLAVARLDAAEFRKRVAPWSSSADWRERATAAEGWGLVHPLDTAQLVRILADRDLRVAAAALGAWGDAVQGPDPGLVMAARRLLTSPDPVLRSLAADAIARAADPADLPALKRAWTAAAHDSIPDAAISVLGAVQAIAAAGESARHAALGGFVESTPRPGDYLLRRWAADHWPELADHWGGAGAVEVSRSMQDYRELALKFLAVPGADQMPHVIIETPRGKIELELNGPQAPLTVANFLRLVDRHYFDNQRWHRVVPDFVAQAGDPRGDGWGGPGWAVRDEINPVRYGPFVVGMALSGPDTGGSQWFITLSPAPHLDGGYTVFGRVYAGQGTLLRIAQGDLITSIHR
ncbi:MAG TPA: HEAT repeat domain-containing protein [Gemmatimonadales bacterium]|nr:HEAT repeat domain-containing protein [Gemmatimonadales bacterium]